MFSQILILPMIMICFISHYASINQDHKINNYRLLFIESKFFPSAYYLFVLVLRTFLSFHLVNVLNYPSDLYCR